MYLYKYILEGLPWWLSGKNTPANAGDMGSIPGLGRSPGEGNGNLRQYSCLENILNRGAWQATVSGVARVTRVPALGQEDPLEKEMATYTSIIA